MMDYKVIAARQDIGQIDVEYSYDGKPLAVYAIDVPVVNGAYLTGEQLHNEILHRAPTWLVQREQERQSATGFESIAALVAPPPAEPRSQQVAEAQARDVFDRRIAEALVRFGLLDAIPAPVSAGE